MNRRDRNLMVPSFVRDRYFVSTLEEPGCIGAGYAPKDGQECCSETPYCATDGYCRTQDYCDSLGGCNGAGLTNADKPCCVDTPWCNKDGYCRTAAYCSSLGSGCVGAGFKPDSDHSCCSDTPLCEKDGYCRTTNYCSGTNSSLSVTGVWWYDGAAYNDFLTKCGQTTITKDHTVSHVYVLVENSGGADSYAGANIVDSSGKQIATSAQVKVIAKTSTTAGENGKVGLDIPFTPPDSGGNFEVRVFETNSNGISVRSLLTCGFSVDKKQSPPSEKTHRACVDGTCQSIAGDGKDTCSNVGSNCDVSEKTHKACVDGTCQLVPGDEKDSCFKVGSKCKSESKDQHLECVQNKCQAVPGSGKDSCVSDATCSQSQDILGGIPPIALLGIPLLLVLVMLAK